MSITLKIEDYTAEFMERLWIKLSKDGVKGSMYLYVPVLFYRHQCNPQLIDYGGEKIPCSRLCCYCGCYMYENEKERIVNYLDGIRAYLSADAKKVLEETNDMFYCNAEQDEESKKMLFKTKAIPNEWNEEELLIDSENHIIPKNRCIFLMDNGLCALHAYINAIGHNWVKEKIQICSTFPLVVYNTKEGDVVLSFMDGHDDFTYDQYICLHQDEDLKKQFGLDYIITTSKDIITNYAGKELYDVLVKFANDYRSGKYLQVQKKWLPPGE